ncbi:hypothetical protein D3C77_568320 [compost metagenome]
MHQRRNQQTRQQQRHRAAAEQGAPRHAVGERTDRQLQHSITDHHSTDHEQRQLGAEALLQAVDRQQRENHRLESGKQGDGPGDHRQVFTEADQVAQTHRTGLAARRTTAPDQGQRSHQHQADADPETQIVVAANQPEQQRSGQLTEGVAAAI